MLWLFCAFKRNLRVLVAKIAFWEDWGEELRFEEARGTKNNAERAKQARHGRALRRPAVRPQTSTTKPARKVARPGRAGWHDRATKHGCAKGVPAQDMWFHDFLFGTFLIPHFSFLSSCFRVLEWGLRESSKLRFNLLIYAFGLTIYQDSTIVLPSSLIYTSLFCSLLLFDSCSRFLCVFQWLSNWMLGFVFLLWLQVRFLILGWD